MWKKLARAVAFVTIGVALFWGLQWLLVPNNDEMAEMSDRSREIAQLKHSDLHVVSIGNSHVFCGISPMVLYEEYQLRAYDLGSPAQPIECTLYYVKQALKTAPHVIILDVGNFYVDTKSENYNSWLRFVLDTAPLSVDKLKLIDQYKSFYFSDSASSVLFPLIKYHSRWTELGEKDFAKEPAGLPECAYGQRMVPLSFRTPWTKDTIDYQLEIVAGLNQGFARYREGNEEYKEKIAEPLYAPQMAEDTKEYVLKIKELCDANGVLLLLIKIPTQEVPNNYGAWNRVKYEQVKDFAGENGIDYFDLQYDTDVGLLQNEWGDEGKHLNLRGARKVSTVLGEYLVDRYGLTGHSDPGYDRNLKIYQAVEEIGYLNTEMDMGAYLRSLAEHKDEWDVFVSAQTEYTSQMEPEDYALLSELGLAMIVEGQYMDSYLGVARNGTAVYEALSDRVIEHELMLDDHSVKLGSVNAWANDFATHPTIQIDGVEHAQGGSGLNFVVRDKSSGLVIDSVSFNTFNGGRAASRNWTRIMALFDDYEAYAVSGMGAA